MGSVAMTSAIAAEPAIKFKHFMSSSSQTLKRSFVRKTIRAIEMSRWTPTVARALRLIEERGLEDDGIEGLAERLGVGSRHLRRLFLRHLGAPPVAVAQTRRVHFAKKLIDDTNLPMTQIAIAAGYGSVRRF